MKKIISFNTYNVPIPIAIFWVAINGMAFNAHGQLKDTLYLLKGQILIGDILSAQTGTVEMDETDLNRFIDKII